MVSVVGVHESPPVVVSVVETHALPPVVVSLTEVHELPPVVVSSVATHVNTETVLDEEVVICPVTDTETSKTTDTLFNVKLDD